MTKQHFKMKIRKLFHSIAVFTLLLPNVLSIGVVTAQENDAQEPAVEETQSNEEVNTLLQEPQEVLVRVNVRTPANMENYANTLTDFTNHPIILTNRVTGDTYTASIIPSKGNTSNNFTFEATVLSYDRGYPPENYYDISLPQALIDLGYSLTRNHDVRSNNGIIGLTTLSYNAPLASEDLLQLSKRTDYSYLEGQAIEFILTSTDGLRTYRLSNRTILIPAGTYNLRVINLPTNNTRPELMYRESSLTNAPQREIELTPDGNDYIGTVNLDYSQRSRAQMFSIRPVEIPEDTSHTVIIDPNGGTIDENYASTEVAYGESYTLPYNFQSNLARPGYTLTGYSVEGTLLDANGNEVTEISRYTGTYTPMSDVTLTANWATTSGGFRVLLYDDNPAAQTTNYSVKLLGGDGTEFSLSRRSYNNQYSTWSVDDVPNGNYTLVIDGFNISEGEKFGQSDTTSDFSVNEDGTASVELEFVDDKSTTFIRYRVYGEPVPKTNTVIIHPNGGTIDEEYASTEVAEGDTYTLPYNFQSKLVRPGYTLTGYSVEGTLLDANGNEVTELSRYTGTFTPVSDVTLTAIWEVTSGGVRIRDHIDNFIIANRSFALTDGENTYPLTSNSYTNNYREWRVDNIPNGVYTLLVDGVAYASEWNLDTTNTHSSATINPDGTATLDLTFNDDSTTTFVRFDLTMNEYEVGVEVRDLNNKRTSDVGILVENSEGTVFEGSFDQYQLWTTTHTVLPGTYTITLTTPEGTVAEINPTVASQSAVPTNEDNVFTVEVNKESKGNLSRVFGAFRLVEVPVEIEQYFLGIEIRDLNNRRTSEVGVVVTNADGEIFNGSYNEYNQWLTDNELPIGEYTITLTTPEGTVAEVNPTVASQSAVATDEENVFSILINAENKGSLQAVYGAFRLVEVEEPTPKTDADRYEPVFVDEIVLDLNHGNGKLKNPKTYIQNMNEMPGGIKVEYTNLDVIDLTGKTTSTQLVEITTTYRDGSKDVNQVPLRVIPKEKPQQPDLPNIGNIIRGVIKVVQKIVSVLSNLFGRFF